LLTAMGRLRQMLPTRNYVSFIPFREPKTSFSITVAS